MVCRNPIATNHEEEDAIEILNKLRNWFYKFQKKNEGIPASVIGFRMYRKMEKLFGRYDDLIVIPENEEIDFSCWTDYNIEDCEDWWDLCDTEEIDLT